METDIMFWLSKDLYELGLWILTIFIMLVLVVISVILGKISVFFRNRREEKSKKFWEDK